MKHEDYERAATYWTRKDEDAAGKAGSAKMDADQLQQEIEAFLAEHNTCALATGTGAHLRCTPLEYTYHDGAFWIFSEGGRKFLGLEKSPHVALAVYERYEGFGSLGSVQVEGTAQALLPEDDGYASAAAFRHIPLKTLQSLPEPMYLIKIVPERMDYLRSDLKQRGFSSRQHLEL